MDASIIIKIIPMIWSPVKSWIDNQVQLNNDKADSLHDDIAIFLSELENEFLLMQNRIFEKMYEENPMSLEQRNEVENVRGAITHISDGGSLKEIENVNIEWWSSVFMTWFDEKIASDKDFIAMKKRFVTKFGSFKISYGAEKLKFLNNEKVNTEGLLLEKDRFLGIFDESLVIFFQTMLKHSETLLGRQITPQEGEQAILGEQIMIALANEFKPHIDKLFDKMIYRIGG